MAPPNSLAFAAWLRLYWATNTQLAINTLGVRVTGNPTFDVALANRLGVAIKNAFTANIGPQQATTSSLVRIGIRDWRTPSQAEFKDTGPAVSGTAAGEGLPSQIALCITLRTALVGKSHRGRCYLPGWSEAYNVAGGQAASGVASAAVTFIQAIDTALKAEQMALAVISKPAERSTLVRTTFHNDGTTTAETLSNVSQKAGEVLLVTQLESRNVNWETQRRRANQRGATPSSLVSAASVDLVA